MKKVLVINAGSSSLKYQLIDMKDESVIAKGIVERIGSEGSMLTHKPDGKDKMVIKQDLKDHMEAIKLVLDALTNREYGVVKNMSEIRAVGHRVLHGGEKFTGSFIINDEVLDAIRENIELGPLHNPANIMGIEACQKIMPGVPMVAVFDTAFHQTMPEQAYLYGLPMEVYEKYKVRRYGFHGTSHKYVSLRVAEILHKDVKDLKIITCHLGNGSSITAIDGGKSVDTSMGITPLEGLVMGTRSGSIDPTIVQFLMRKMDMNIDEMLDYLNKQSGVLGLSGVSSDFRDLWEAAHNGNERAKIALHVFCYRIKKYIGAYAAAMGGVDVIAFCGGVGENDWDVRALSVEGLEFMGIKLDLDANLFKGKERIISEPDSKVTVMVVPTNEELMIARETYEMTMY